MVIVKKYTNRRLYDTEESRYVTMYELADKVRKGTDVQVLDAKTNEDLTQATLLQIILETKAAHLLPVPLLHRLIRMQDDALAEFFGRYMSSALEMYLAAKQGAQAVAPYFPFATLPLQGATAFARYVKPLWGEAPPAPPPPPAPAPAEPARPSDVERLREELAELREMMRAATPKRVTKRR